MKKTLAILALGLTAIAGHAATPLWYYFEVNKVLTPEQRTQVKKDLADALSE